jgi:hypothetical protein
MSILLRRGVGVEEISVEAFTGKEAGTGVSLYASVVEIDARIRRSDELRLLPDGTAVRVSLNLWIDADELYHPRRGDRVTRSGDTYVVLETKDVLDPSGVLRIVRADCRDE